MSEFDADITQPALTGEIVESDEAFLEIVFANAGIKEALAAYLDSESGVGERDVEELLAEFSTVIAGTGIHQGVVDTKLIRFAFDHLAESMNEVASERFGYEPPETSFQAVLGWFGVGQQPRQYVRPLDDRYWSKQFMDQYENGGNPMIQERGIETEQEYLARYVHGSMKGFLFAPFTYLAG